MSTASDGGEWVDIRMTAPEEGEWDVDVIVLDGQVECVELRIRSAVLADFVDCLADDLGPERTWELADRLADSDGATTSDAETVE